MRWPWCWRPKRNQTATTLFDVFSMYYYTPREEGLFGAPATCTANGLVRACAAIAFRTYVDVRYYELRRRT